MEHFRKFLAVASLCAASAMPAAAQGEAAPPPDLPPFALFDSVEQATGVKVFGFVQLGYSANDTSTHAQATGGHSNYPLVGPADEGLQFNALQLAFQRPMQSNILPRITPIPGPMPWEFSWGFRGELLYGRNGLPAAVQGLENNWGINRNPPDKPVGTTRQNYLAFPQLYGEFFFPFAQGVALTIGRFGSGIGREIPPEFRPNPNFFYSRTYAFVSQPDQVVGALLSANLMRNDKGFIAGELGLVQGRQNFQDNNPQKSVIGALRWRSPDMGTAVDYSFMAGDEQNSPSVFPQAPIARVISPRGQLRQHHSLTGTLHPADGWEVVGELLYGKQRGDGRADTVDILTGPFYKGGRYGGANGEVRYRLTNGLQLGVRGEVFVDRQATALFPTTAVAGDFNALTIGARYDINKNIVIRPEIRYDRQRHNNGVNAFGSGTASQQTTFSADVVLTF